LPPSHCSPLSFVCTGASPAALYPLSLHDALPIWFPGFPPSWCTSCTFAGQPWCTWCTFAGQKNTPSDPWCCSSLPPRYAEAEAAPQLPRAREEEEDLRLVRPSYCSTPVFGGTYPGILGYVPRFSGVRRDLRFSWTVRRAPASPAPAAR